MGGEYRPILTNIVQGRKHKVDSEFLDGKALEGIWANVWKEILVCECICCVIVFFGLKTNINLSSILYF